MRFNCIYHDITLTNGSYFFWIQIHENMTFWTNFGQILRLIQGKTLEQTRMICPSLRLLNTL